ncbi:MAG: molybdopterin-dependent oxidoreductase, partial [Waddliaceae bacterium]
MDKITRRDFFKLMGTGTASLWFLPFSTDKLATFSEEPESWPLGKEHFVYSVCDQCPSGCGVVGRVVDGKVKKLDGNPNHPTNRGKLCPIGQAGTQLLYNPDRLREPLRQSGSKGSGRWQTTSWEEAIEAIAKQLRQLRANGQPHHHAILTGEDNSDFSVLLNRFMESFGSPNYFRNIPARALRTAHFLTQGTYTLPAYDLEQANLILSFGAPLLEKWLSPMQSQRAYGYLRQERKGHRAKFIQVESRFSVTAAKADQWVPIRPGTEGALALGIAYVLIKEKLYHKQFVEDETFGFEDWKDDKGQKHRGFKKYALKFYGPERVSEITGISVSSIVKLAKGLSSIRPALVIGGGATSLYSNATHTEMAIHSLNALLGSLEVPGGLTHQQRVNLMPFPKVGLDTIAHNGLTQPVIDSPQKAIFSLPSHDPDMLIESVLTGKPY